MYKYAAYGHIYKSSNKGKTWKKIANGLPETLDVARIIVNPNNSNEIILAANTGIYKSTDQGENWTLSGKGLPNNLPRDLTSYYDSKICKRNQCSYRFCSTRSFISSSCSSWFA